MGLARIREMRKEDLPAAVDVLGRAFATQPNVVAVYGGAPASPLSVGAGFAARFKHLPGRVMVAELEGEVVGAMRMVEWPGCQASLAQSLAMMPSMLRSIGGLGRLRRAIVLLEAWKRHDPKRPHWHLDPLGVAPEMQGRGIGSQMMEFYCGVVDAAGMVAYHETDRPENVPFYERFGFEVLEEEEINGAPNWFMARPAASDRSAGTHRGG